MSRLLILRRPQATRDDLEYTALNIAQGYMKEQMSGKLKLILKTLTYTYSWYLECWKGKKNNFRLLYGLRDFYGLIKNFMSKIQSI